MAAGRHLTETAIVITFGLLATATVGITIHHTRIVAATLQAIRPRTLLPEVREQIRRAEILAVAAGRHNLSQPPRANLLRVRFPRAAGMMFRREKGVSLNVALNSDSLMTTDI